MRNEGDYGKDKVKKGLLHLFENSPKEIKWSFEYLPDLLASFPLDVVLAYVFSRIEQSHRMGLYCGLVKIHKADAGLARRAVQLQHITRPFFKEKFSLVYGQQIPHNVLLSLTHAEAVRDLVLHGMPASDDQKRNAIAHSLVYATDLNSFIVSLNGPRPFGDLRGYNGAGKTHDRNTTRWMLKGMGFDLK